MRTRRKADHAMAETIRMRTHLQPYVSMLLHKRSKQGYTKWIEFVMMTKKAILNNPDQYVGKDRPRRKRFEEIVELIFIDLIDTP